MLATGLVSGHHPSKDDQGAELRVWMTLHHRTTLTCLICLTHHRVPVAPVRRAPNLVTGGHGIVQPALLHSTHPSHPTCSLRHVLMTDHSVARRPRLQALLHGTRLISLVSPRALGFVAKTSGTALSLGPAHHATAHLCTARPHLQVDTLLHPAAPLMTRALISPSRPPE